MQRRDYLVAAAATVGAAAGCVGAPGGCRETVADPASAVARPQFEDISLPVPRSELVVGAPSSAIRAVGEPTFARDWGGVDGSLTGDDLVIGVASDGHARAYPLTVLTTHEVVNDVFPAPGGDAAGRPLLVTYCPLCASGVTAVRTVDGGTATFSVSGLLYRSDLVLYDHATGSLWSQIMATAISGPATGDRLELVPSSLSTWENWRSLHPDTEVLLPPDRSATVAPPLDPLPRPGSANSGHVGATGVAREFEDDRLPARELVVGVAAGGAARAYPLSTIRERGAVNDCVGGVPVVVAADRLAHAYVRVVDGERLRFREAEPGRLRAGGSVWAVTTGRAVAGPHEGRQLRPASRASSMYWFAWLDFHPSTSVYGE